MFRRAKRKCKKLMRADILRSIMGCNMSKDDIWSPSPIQYVIRQVRANTAPQTRKDVKVKGPPVPLSNPPPYSTIGPLGHAPKGASRKGFTCASAQEDDAACLLALGASPLAQLTVNRSPSSPSLMSESGCGLSDDQRFIRRPRCLAPCPAYQPPDQTEACKAQADTALLDALLNSTKTAVQLNRHVRLFHRRSRSIE